MALNLIDVWAHYRTMEFLQNLQSSSEKMSYEVTAYVSNSPSESSPLISSMAAQALSNFKEISKSTQDHLKKVYVSTIA